jgi:lysophospholipase L1-like esterase
MKTKSKAIFLLYAILVLSCTCYFSFKIIQNNSEGIRIGSGRFFIVFPLKFNFLITNKSICKELATPCIRQVSNNTIPWEWIPNCEEFYCGWFVSIPPTKIKINSDGFRDYEYKIEKPPNNYRIIALGDSFTFGAGVELEDSWPKILEKKLNELNNGIHYEVLNFGIPGYNVYDQVEFFKIKGVKYNPELVIFTFLGNDIENSTALKEKIQYYTKKYKEGNLMIPTNVSVSGFIVSKANWDYYTELQHQPFEEVWRIVDNPIHELVNISKEKKFKLLLLMFNYAPEQRERLIHTCSELEIPLIDLQVEVFKKYGEKTFIPLDLHPSKFGNEKIAEVIKQKLEILGYVK